MEQTTDRPLIADDIRRMISLTLTIIAAFLYALVLGNAVVRTISESAPQFSDNMIRAAGLLSGLVGSVVTAGFARGQRSDTVHVGVRLSRASRRLDTRALFRLKFLGLARILGLYVTSDASESTDRDEETVPAPVDTTTPMWIALLYFVIYFVVGVGAFGVTLWRLHPPEIVTTAGWVWLGTVISSAYSFIGVNGGR